MFGEWNTLFMAVEDVEQGEEIFQPALKESQRGKHLQLKNVLLGSFRL